MTTSLNWREIALWTETLRPEIEGLFIDRIIVPERAQFPDGYLKGEWALRLSGRNDEGTLILSVRPRHPYLIWSPGKGPRAAPDGTRSAFDLSLSKNLKGSRMVKVEALFQERAVVLWFQKGPEERLGLVLMMIPAMPEAILVSAGSPATDSSARSGGWPVIARSRKSGDASIFQAPDGSKAPQDMPIREELVGSPVALFRAIEEELNQEAFVLRIQAAERALKQKLKQAQDRLRHSEKSLAESGQEKDWQRLGDLLKFSIHSGGGKGAVASKESQRLVVDYETGENITIVCDPKLSLQQQVEKFYQNARRRKKRISEAESRIGLFSESIQSVERLLRARPEPGNWKALATWETQSGIGAHTEAAVSEKSSKKGGGWWGKSFVSKDGFTIWAGRDKTENLDLTFKFARGNDIWMHVRGKPGAHIVIPLPAKKSAPLETLLDAAQLALHYSGGDHWGKTEVDYTFKKYVKRIKDSSEASYTNNKTLIVAGDAERLKRLLGQSNACVL